MDPTVPPSPTPATTATPADPLVEFVRAQRQMVGYVLLSLAVALLLVALFLAYRGLRPGGLADTAPAPELTLPGMPKPEIANPKRASYIAGLLAAALGFVITAGGGAWLTVSVPPPEEDRQRTQVRVALLAVGGLLGLVLIVFGGVFFYLWSDSLGKWLDKGETAEMKWVLLPVLLVVAGAGLVLAAVQPARSEERNNTALRRLVYGANFGLTVLLLSVVVVVANVLFALKVPNQLDTTETGFYSLSESTKLFLSQLPEPVTAYLIIPTSDDREENDLRQFLLGCQEASAGKLKVKSVSPISNRTEVAALQAKYPRIPRDSDGVLLTVGEDEKRNNFIPFTEMFEFGRSRSRRAQAFSGEGRVMRELRFLIENEQKPVIYFTQSNGELSIGVTEGEVASGGSASQLKAHLEKNYLDVRPLVFPLKDPSVPDDAAVVIVAEPQTPLSEAAAGAIRKYMTTPRPDGRKGKLMVFSGATPGPSNRGVAKTGLEQLLSEFGVRLGEKFVYSIPTQSVPSPTLAIAQFARASENNPIVQTIGSAVNGLPFINPREVAPLNSAPGMTALPLMLTTPGRFTWLEDDKTTDWERILTELEDNQAVQQRKGLSRAPRSVAAVVTEGGSGRVAVYGNGLMISDEFPRRLQGGSALLTITHDLVGATIDWLRDRPPLATGIESKKYKEYTFPPPEAIDTTRLQYLPLGLALLAVIGLGAGVWVIRRK
jgi:hypothetical protein